MKNILFALISSTILTSYGILPWNSTKHGPLLIIDTSAANFGMVPNRGFVEHIFALRNAGDSTLRITGVYPSCGCTVASLNDSIVPVGQSTKLLIRLDAKDKMPGGFEKAVYLSSNSRDTSRRWFIFYGRFIQADTNQTPK
ncbi:MAG: DUF1573 domain-containing protein [Candidatus Kapaibacterium sp.]